MTLDEFLSIRHVLFGALLLGAVGGLLGTFALLRRQSLLGDALAHASLPGVCIAFLIVGTKDPLALLGGAMVAGVAGALYLLWVVRGTRIKDDAAIGIVLSVFFGLGAVLLSWIQKGGSGHQSGLDAYLFGQAVGLMARDVRIMAILAAAVLLILLCFWKEFKLLVYDPGYGGSLGFPMRRLEILLVTLLVVVVVVGLQMVGAVLVIAALITPAAAARQWTDRLGWMAGAAAFVGALAGAGGTVASFRIDKIPPGPAIVLLSSLVLAVSLTVAPRRGLLWAHLRERRVRRKTLRENLLKDLYRLGEDTAAWERAVPLPEVMGVRGQAPGKVGRIARRLTRRGLLLREGDGLRLTPAGREEASQVVRRHRLWELYLFRRLSLPSDHVHRDAEMMEHVLSDRVAEEIAEVLGHPERDPHGRVIPPRRGTV